MTFKVRVHWWNDGCLVDSVFTVNAKSAGLSQAIVLSVLDLSKGPVVTSIKEEI